MKIEQAKALRLEANINRDDEVSRAGRRFSPAWLVAGGVLALALAGWFLAPRGADAPSVAEPAAAAPAASASASDGAFTAAGYIEPIPPFPVKITPLIPGRIDRFAIREGESVKAGDVIATMNTGLLENRAAELKAAAAVTLERLGLAERELARAKTLSARGATPQRELDQATAEAGILRAEAGRITAELETVQWQIEQSTIRSPVDGVLFERSASEGDYINLDERHEIASVVDPAQMQVWVDINQRDVARIRDGGQALVSLDAEPGREFLARVDRILPRASLAKNTVRVVLRLEESSPALRPDMSVKVTFSEP
ncbi:MAG: efflux RND transporter periplasmic adaptor subunit [Terrimicrobiaceae bacterium]|nr:efflux RND transporter periplasmic adaptor subunit [Terrimicrobiaceae bacterium]